MPNGSWQYDIHKNALVGSTVVRMFSTAPYIKHSDVAQAGVLIFLPLDTVPTQYK